jgi:hypothetical protein
MKVKLIFCLILLTGWIARGQGTFTYDQQSTNIVEGSVLLNLDQPLGQSFTPGLPAVGFIELNLYDADVLHNFGATVVVNLRSNSISGPILGVSVAIFMPDNFFGVTNFTFMTPVSVVPGAVYYLQPVVQSGDGMGSYVTDGSYLGGVLFSQGIARPTYDMWFREGVIPEPSTFALTGIALAMLALYRHRRR